MKYEIESRETERGFAMVAALLTLLVLMTLSSGVLFVTQAGMWSATNYKSLTQARFESEAGLQRTLQWFNSSSYVAGSGYGTSSADGTPTSNGQPVVLSGTNPSSNYPNTTVRDSFYNALHSQTLSATGVPAQAGYSTWATLLRATGSTETWRVISQGNIPGTRAAAAQSEMIIERTVGDVPLFRWSWFGTGTGCQDVSFGGSGGGTGSFDSRLGPYNALTNSQRTDGDIGSNGNIELKSANDIGGMAWSPWTDTNVGNCSSTNSDAVTYCSNGCVVEEQPVQKLDAALTFPSVPPVTNPTPGTTTQTVTNCNFTGCSVVQTTPSTIYALAPGAYDNLVLTGGSPVQFRAGTYNVNSFTKWAGELRVVSGPVVINVAGTGVAKDVINFSSATIANPSGIPSNLTINYGGTVGISMTGGADSYALMYAPNAPVVIGGGGTWYGAGISKTLELTGGSMLYYDRALGSTTGGTGSGPFRALSLSRSKY